MTSGCKGIRWERDRERNEYTDPKGKLGWGSFFWCCNTHRMCPHTKWALVSTMRFMWPPISDHGKCASLIMQDASTREKRMRWKVHMRILLSIQFFDKTKTALEKKNESINLTIWRQDTNLASPSVSDKGIGQTLEREHKSSACIRRGCSLWLSTRRDLKEAKRPRDPDMQRHLSNDLKLTSSPTAWVTADLTRFQECASPSQALWIFHLRYFKLC